VASFVHIEGLSICIGQNAYQHLVANVQIEYIVTAWKAVVGMSLAHPLIKAANFLVIDICDQVPLR
jgi:hypothetical protein